MGDIIDISKIIEENNFETLLEHFVKSYPNENRRIITEQVMIYYPRYIKTHTYQQIKTIVGNKIAYLLAIHRECHIVEEQPDNIIPFKKD